MEKDAREEESCEGTRIFGEGRRFEMRGVFGMRRKKIELIGKTFDGYICTRRGVKEEEKEMGYIGAHGVAALHRHKYSGVDHSLVAKYVLQPFWTRCYLDAVLHIMLDATEALTITEFVEPERLKNRGRSYENGHGAPFVPAVHYDESGFSYTSVTGEIILSLITLPIFQVEDRPEALSDLLHLVDELFLLPPLVDKSKTLLVTTPGISSSSEPF
ncbi:aminoalcoholphosphotransferase 1 [Striga asiatica]|uniref:Aminoalcoholphosphotransferase 1 n=1 Tax=Striga asiatica TaxID=4170 RepID=A0A5A7QG48_STRAF|nr:aminoalcoholphosphotransferase 1 [Striga asiatica]